MEDDKPTRIKPQPTDTQGTDTRIASKFAQEATVKIQSPTQTADLPTQTREGATAAAPTEVATAVAQTAGSSISKTASQSVFAHLDRKIAEEYKGKKLLKQRFALLDTLGTGGMGNVYLAKDLLREEMEDSSPFVAIKVLNDQCRNLPGALQSLQREAKKAQVLSHPNIVTVYDFDRDGETAFITMEYIDGKELKDSMRNGKRIAHKQAMHIIERVARGLAYAHQQGFAHSDIKPANIFLGADKTIKILDFGIAKAFKDAVKEKRTLADELTEGALTPSYASAEMLAGLTPIAADDVYSLAVMAYEMLAGHHPFIGANGKPIPADEACKQQLKVEPITGVPSRHMRAIRKGLAFKRVDRFKDAGLFIDAIKPRNVKKDLFLLGSAAALSGLLMFSVSKGLEQVVPSVSSLKPELTEVADTVLEADEFLAQGEVDMAHRLYSQAWELANDLTVEDIDEREKSHMILKNRMGKVADHLITRARQSDIDEYHLRELYVALEFLLKDEITDNPKKIEQALTQISSKLN